MFFEKWILWLLITKSTNNSMNCVPIAEVPLQKISSVEVFAAIWNSYRNATVSLEQF